MAKEKKVKKKKSILRRLLKWTGITFLFLLILAIVLPWLFKDEIVDYIEVEAGNYLNADLEFGEVELSFISTFPNFVLEMSNTSLTGKGEFEGVQLFSSEKFVVSMNIKSVLFGDQYEINGIDIDGLKANIQVTKEGLANYDIVIPDTAAVVDTAPVEPSNFKMALQSYSITNASIVYDDKYYDMYMGLQGMNHRGSGDFTASIVNLETKTDMKTVDFKYGGVPYIKEAVIDILCNLEMDMDKMRFQFKENNVKINALELLADGWLAMPGDDIDMDITYSMKDAKFRKLLSLVPGVYSPDFGDIKTDGTVAFSGGVKGKYNETSMPGFNVDMKVGNAFVQYPGLPGKIEKINIDASVKSPEGSDMNKMVVSVPKLHAEFSENYIDGNLDLRNVMVDPTFKMGLKSFLDLGKLKSVIPVAEGESYSGIINTDMAFAGTSSQVMEENYEALQASGQMNLSKINYQTAGVGYATTVDTMNLTFNPSNVSLNQFKSTMGNTDVQANGTLDNYLAYFLNDENLKGTLSVISNKMDFDQLMAVSDEEVVVETTDTTAYEVVPIPRNIDFMMRTTVGEMLYDGVSYKNIAGDVKVYDGIATLTNMKMDALGGQIGMNGTYNTQDPKKPAVDFDFDLRNMDIAQTATSYYTVGQFAPIAKKCKGIFSSTMNFKTELNSDWTPVYSSILGAGNLSTNRVDVEGSEPLTKLADALKIDKLAKQTINDVKCSFAILDGKLHVKPFTVEMAGIKTDIQGSTSFEQDIDYGMKMMIPRSKMGAQAGAVLDGLVATANSNGINTNVGDEIPVGVRMTGTVLQPKITTDFKAQGADLMEDIKGQVVDAVKEEVQEVIDGVKEDVSAEVDKIMADAQAQADKVKADAKIAADKVRAEGKKSAEAIRVEGYKQADALIAEANNPIAKKAAEKAAEKSREQTDIKAQKVEDESNKKADGIEAAAQKKSDDIMAAAQVRADKVKNADTDVN